MASFRPHFYPRRPLNPARIGANSVQAGESQPRCAASWQGSGPQQVACLRWTHPVYAVLMVDALAHARGAGGGFDRLKLWCILLPCVAKQVFGADPSPRKTPMPCACVVWKSGAPIRANVSPGRCVAAMQRSGPGQRSLRSPGQAAEKATGIIYGKSGSGVRGEASPHSNRPGASFAAGRENLLRLPVGSRRTMGGSEAVRTRAKWANRSR